ncbi:MAG TPA: hypothetical protein VKQ72_23135 [Aggregatilineales bacterium]|nr:hypothetical protein [Aggregatilineales bacterium]
MTITKAESYLPDLIHFIENLSVETTNGQLTSASAFSERVQAFFTRRMLDKTDSVLPGWRKMASYGKGVTLIHVITVFVALLQCPEYVALSPDEQLLMHWIVLFHDIAKVIDHKKERGDSMHAFRSAVAAGRGLFRLGFAAWDSEPAIKLWADLTGAASLKTDDTGDEIPDNRRLPEILAGIDRLFEKPAGLIIMVVLFHLGINVLQEWPQDAPLTDGEIQRYLDKDLSRLLKVMMLVDSDAWAFFDPDRKQRQHLEILTTFERVERLVAQRKPNS